MYSYSHKLVTLMVRCLLFSLIGGTLFAAITGTALGGVPYIIALGTGAGWKLTQPMGMIAVGKIV